MLGANKLRPRSGISRFNNSENTVNSGVSKEDEDELEIRVMNMTVSQKAAYFKSQMVVNEGALNETKVERKC